jgi:hypothetical protein
VFLRFWLSLDKIGSKRFANWIEPPSVCFSLPRFCPLLFCFSVNFRLWSPHPLLPLSTGHSARDVILE